MRGQIWQPTASRQGKSYVRVFRRLFWISLAPAISEYLSHDQSSPAPAAAFQGIDLRETVGDWG